MINKLTLQNFCVSYGTKSVIDAMNGEFFVGAVNLVVGRAGSGKSSLLLAMAGFHKEFSGSIATDGEKFIPDGNFSLTFQNPESLFFNPTVGDEIEFSLRMLSFPASQIRSEAENWLRRWGLEPDLYYHRHPFELSGGEKRRVALAACTVARMPLILLDEPLAGLDGSGQKSLASILESLAREHIVVVVTHEPEIFLTPTSNILFLREGQGSWFNGNDFLRQALTDNLFYPLPEWYYAAVRPYKNEPFLPIINAVEVGKFLQKAGQPCS